MGYESKIYIVEEFAPPREGLRPYGNVLATMDLCKMGYDIYHGKAFRELFSQERTADFYKDDWNTIVDYDCYGEAVEKADIDTVIEWLEEFVVDTEYWRASIFLDLLRAIKEHNGGRPIYVYHYGY